MLVGFVYLDTASSQKLHRIILFFCVLRSQLICPCVVLIVAY
jgi:hypothetical protein